MRPGNIYLAGFGSPLGHEAGSRRPEVVNNVDRAKIRVILGRPIEP